MNLPIRPLHNKIFFQFEERIITNNEGNRSFEATSESGVVVLGNTDDATKKARWATVLSVGPKVDSLIKPGSRIMIDALRWTEVMTFEDIDFWQTNDEEVLIVQD